MAACAAPEQRAAPAGPWQPLTSVTFDAATGHSESVSLPASEGRVALRISSTPDTCFQVIGATDASGVELAQPFAGPECVDCAWRTAMVREAGVLVLTGPAEGLSSVQFGRVDCQSMAGIVGPGAVTVERLITSVPSEPTLALRLVSTTEVDVARLAEDLAAELAGVRIEIVATVTIAPRELRLDGRSDVAALAALIADLPPQDDGVIDVVIGPCLIRADPFSTQRLAGLTPRIPGGAGPADAVFISRQTCGSRDDSPDRPEVVARLVAHELGHYLGLFHPEEADGTVDAFVDTAIDNLMHRFPLLRDAQGLTDAQYARLIAHPFVRE